VGSAILKIFKPSLSYLLSEPCVESNVESALSPRQNQFYREMGDLMSVSARIVKLGLGAALLFAGVGCLAQNDNSVVAVIDGVKVTMSDLEREESASLLSAHYQYYQTETKALNDLIDKKLLEEKAKSQNITVDQLIERDIKAKVQDPTEDQMKVYYEGVETDQPYEQVRTKIMEKIRSLRIARVRAAYLADLRVHSTVSITLAPPAAGNIEAEMAQSSSDKPQVTLVEFADYECPYCQKVAADVNKLRADLGDKVNFQYKDFPLQMHARAEKAAEAARCAGKQGKFWELHDEIFKSKELDVDQLKAQARSLNLNGADFDKCLDSGEETAAIEKDRKDGLKLGISGTPSFFINGHYLSGALDYAALRQIVDQQLTMQVQTASNGSGKTTAASR
jgi:protein-disulfide isomerase